MNTLKQIVITYHLIIKFMVVHITYFFYRIFLFKYYKSKTCTRKEEKDKRKERQISHLIAIKTFALMLAGIVWESEMQACNN